MRKLIIILLGAFIGFNLFAQIPKPDIHLLEAHYKSFEYARVIELADSLLLTPKLFDTSTLIVIYNYKALSHFSLTELDKAFTAFSQILELDPTYELDPKHHSPKIIEFFDNIRNVQTQPLEVREKVAATDTVWVRSAAPPMQNFVPISLLVPGSAHLKIGKKFKGTLLTTLSTAALGGMLWQIYDCHQKQNDYMTALKFDEIESTYKAYNAAFQKRNLYIAAYSLLWVYTQVDLLYFEMPRLNASLTFSSQILHESPALTCSLHF